MVSLNIGKRIEIEYERGVVFFVRLPLLGDLLWQAGDGWQYWTWREVKEQRAKVERHWAERRAQSAA